MKVRHCRGNKGLAGKRRCESIFFFSCAKRIHVLIYGESELASKKRKNITVLPLVQKGEEERAILKAYEFDRVIYFSQYLTFYGQYEGEMEMLRKALQYCRKREDIQMIYLAGPEGNYSVSTGKTVMAEAAEQLCIHYCELNHMQVKIIRIPYLYSFAYEKDYFCGMLHLAAEKGEIRLPEDARQKMYFLNTADLAELLYRVFDNWDGENETLSVTSILILHLQTWQRRLGK